MTRFALAFLALVNSLHAGDHTEDTKAFPRTDDASTNRPRPINEAPRFVRAEKENPYEFLKSDENVAILKKYAELKEKKDKKLLALLKKIAEVVHHPPISSIEDLPLIVGPDGSALLENKGDRGVLVDHKLGSERQLILLRLDHGTEIPMPDPENIAFIGRFFVSPSGWTILRYNKENLNLTGKFFPRNKELKVEALVPMPTPPEADVSTGIDGPLPARFDSKDMAQTRRLLSYWNTPLISLRLKPVL